MSLRRPTLFIAQAFLPILACSVCSMPAEAGAVSRTASLLEHGERPELSLQSGLWHAEFFAEEEHREEKRPENRSGIRPTPDLSTPNAGKVSESIDSSVVESERQYYDDGLVMLLEDTVSRSELTSAKSVALSEWDKAVSRATGSSAKKLKTEGPTLISVIVAVVGMVVVVGAYCRSARTH